MAHLHSLGLGDTDRIAIPCDRVAHDSPCGNQRVFTLGQPAARRIDGVLGLCGFATLVLFLASRRVRRLQIDYAAD
jgi:hypothetical protein